MVLQGVTFRVSKKSKKVNALKKLTVQTRDLERKDE